jgi:anti-sigma regulatory factor (Ser/Thr protein kinase)
VRATFQAAVGSGAKIRAAVREFLATTPLDDEHRFNVLVAVGEAVSNAIEHPRDRTDDLIEIEARIDDHELVVSVRDAGRWKARPPEPRGRGIWLMRELVRDVRIEQDNGGTLVEIREPVSRRAADRKP